jgi:hypothetical protein
LYIRPIYATHASVQIVGPARVGDAWNEEDVMVPTHQHDLGQAPDRNRDEKRRRSIRRKRGIVMAPHSLHLVALAVLLVFAPDVGRAGGEWPDGPNKEWFQNLQRPDNDAYPERKSDPKSLYCCGAADVVKTKFKVELGGDRYPEDTWYAWLKESWTKIPAEKIVKDYAPNGQPYLFMLAGTIQCFVRPKGGI